MLATDGTQSYADYTSSGEDEWPAPQKSVQVKPVSVGRVLENPPLLCQPSGLVSVEALEPFHGQLGGLMGETPEIAGAISKVCQELLRLKKPENQTQTGSH